MPVCKVNSWLTDSMLCQLFIWWLLATSLQPSLVVILQHISFTLQSNSSTNWFKGHYQNPNTYFQLPLQMAAERETARHLANGESSTHPRLQHVGSTAGMTLCIKSGKRQKTLLLCICTASQLYRCKLAFDTLSTNRKKVCSVLIVMPTIHITALGVWFTMQAATWAGISATPILRIQLPSQPPWVSKLHPHMCSTRARV